MLAASGYVSQIDPERCSGCGLCVKLCQWQALSLKDEIAQIDVSKCMGCGVCVSNCPQQARSLIRHPNQSEPLEIDRLVSKDNFKSVEPSTATDG
jgi:ferredoxin